MEHTLSITEAVDKFVNNIKKKYKGRRIIQEEQLLCCRSEKLVRLELVKKKRLQASKQRGNDDNKDSICNITRTPLAYADLFKVEKGMKEIKMILIDGDAGIGKTTFCIAVCEDWANGKIFQEFELVLLLPLREQEVASAGSLLDLLKLFHPSPMVCDLVKDYFEEDEGSILVIADGWDELGREKRDKGTFLYRLLLGSQYSSVSVVVTSRPSASDSLHYGTCIDRFVEIRGFDKEHIVEYIKSEFADNQAVASDILEKLEGNPLVENICSIPLNCAIICHLWQMLKGILPTTTTELYTKIILNIILRSIHKYPVYENIVNLSSFDDLPGTLQQSWWLLCEFAFQTLKKDQLVFSDKELVEFFPQGLSPGVDIHCFGLLQSSVSMLEVGCGRSFHFLHLTFQEYLAALFMVKQKSCEVAVADSDSLISGLTALFKVSKENHTFLTKEPKSDSIVLRFFFGISYAFETFQNSIGQRILTALTGLDDQCLPCQLVLCHWAFEAHNDQFVRIVIDKLHGSYLLPETTHDFIAVAYVIAKTPECTDKAIRLYGSDLQDYHLTMLTDILANKDGNVRVKSLNLKYINKLSGRSVTGLFDRMAVAFQSLKYLTLDECNVSGGEYINSIIATLAQTFNKCHKVDFSFENNHLDIPSLMVFRDALCHHQLCNLTKLHLMGSLSSDALANADFIQALGHCRGLKILDLSRNNLHEPGGRALGKILPLLSLERLRVSSAKLGDEGMSGLNQGLESTCHIGRLYLGNNDIHAAGISCLADSICAGRMVIKQFLCLNENPLSLKGAEAVVQLLSSEYFKTKIVSLDGCELTTAEGDSAHSISPHSGESITCVGIREWVCGHKIKADRVIILNLFKNNFSGEGIHVLAGFMHLCPHLRSLNCGYCNITSNDLKLLLSLLSQLNLNFESLHMRWSLCCNNLDDDGVSALIEQIPMFPSLTSISICRNSQVSSEMCKSLKEICEKILNQKEIKWWGAPGRDEGAVIDSQSPREESPMLCHENGTDTDINNQCSIPDSVKLTTIEMHPIRQEVQKVTIVVAKEEVSHKQNEDSSDDEEYVTPPSPPVAGRAELQEDESKQSILEARATEDTSNPGHSCSLVNSLCDTSGLGGEGRSASVAGEEEVDQLHQTVESERTATPGPQLGDIILAIKEITEPFILGVHLGIEPHELKKIEKNYPRDLDRQMAEVIEYWLHNSSDCSWGALASAVEKMGGHGNLVKKLRDRHLENTTTMHNHEV